MARAVGLLCSLPPAPPARPGTILRDRPPGTSPALTRSRPAASAPSLTPSAFPPPHRRSGGRLRGSRRASGGAGGALWGANGIDRGGLWSTVERSGVHRHLDGPTGA